MPMHRIFQSYVDRLSESADVEALRAGMAATAAALDLPCFAYVSLPRRPNSQLLHISTYPPAWTAHYLQNRYERLDPVIAQVLNSREPFEWGLNPRSRIMSAPQRQLFDEAAAFGLCHGFTVPIHDDSGPVAAVTFAADENRTARFHRRIEEDGRVLQLMAFYFHSHARRKLAAPRTIDGVELSPRELDCLEWASRGKTAWEIGEILGISRHTATFYLDNVKSKLGVRTIIQAASRFAASKQAAP